jgi:hypothetical protein
LLELDGKDLRGEPLEVRKKALIRQLANTMPGLQLNGHIADLGDVVFRHACQLGYEGIVSQRLGSRYTSGDAVTGSLTEGSRERRKAKKAPAKSPSLESQKIDGSVAAANRDGLHPGFGFGAGLERYRADLDHGRSCRLLVDDSALLRRRILHDVVFGRRLRRGRGGKGRCEHGSEQVFADHGLTSLVLVALPGQGHFNLVLMFFRRAANHCRGVFSVSSLEGDARENDECRFSFRNRREKFAE